MKTNKNKNLAKNIKSSLNPKRVAGIAITTLTLSSTVVAPAQASYLNDVVPKSGMVDPLESVEERSTILPHIPHWIIDGGIHGNWQRPNFPYRTDCFPQPKPTEEGNIPLTYPTDWYSEWLLFRDQNLLSNNG